MLAWAIWMLDIDWNLGRLALLLFTWSAVSCFFYALFIFQATISFWTTESLEMMNTLTYGGVETAQYPLAIYPGWFRRFFTYVVPLGCISYFPSLAILGIEDPLGIQSALPGAAPAERVTCFLRWRWLAGRLGIRHYTSTGS